MKQQVVEHFEHEIERVYTELLYGNRDQVINCVRKAYFAQQILDFLDIMRYDDLIDVYFDKLIELDVIELYGWWVESDTTLYNLESYDDIELLLGDYFYEME